MLLITETKIKKKPKTLYSHKNPKQKKCGTATGTENLSKWIRQKMCIQATLERIECFRRSDTGRQYTSQMFVEISLSEKFD